MQAPVNDGTSPIFFYSTARDLCSARHFTFAATKNTDHGDLCAYIDQAPGNGLWACPAGEARCWTIAKPCLGGGTDVASPNQTQCQSGAGERWCCDAAWEACETESTTRTRICIANTFDNPLAGVQVLVASQVARDAVLASTTGLMLSVPTALSQTASTMNMVVNGVNSILAEATASFTATSAFESTTSSTSTTSSSTTTPAPTSTLLNSPQNVPSSGLSGGAIAGIVVATVGVALLSLVVAFFIFRTRRRKKQRTAAPHADGDPGIRSPLNTEAPPAPQPPPPMASTAPSLQPSRGTVAVREPQTQIRSPTEPELSSPLESDSLIAPSPLQTLMIHGRYPNR